METAQQRWARLHPERIKEIKAKYRKAHPSKSVEGHLKANYGVTLEQREAKIKDQCNRCAICHSEFTVAKPCIDHDHACCAGKKSCGKCLRDVLCFRCNVVLGHVGDNVQLLADMISYLEWWRKHGVQTDPRRNN